MCGANGQCCPEVLDVCWVFIDSVQGNKSHCDSKGPGIGVKSECLGSENQRYQGKIMEELCGRTCEALRTGVKSKGKGRKE